MKFAILIIFFLNYLNVQTSLLNIEELNSVHYNIDIVNSPVLKDQEWTSNIVKVTNKHGQEYICTLPEVTIPENENKKEEDLLDQLVDISELLKPMESAPCLIKKKDWWSYEFCYGSVIKQYHLEDNKVVGNILILGKYESEYNWKNNSKTKNKLQKFHTQSYVNGTRCDITGEPRRAEVRFHCEEGMGDYIQQVDEPESCRYVITIATTRVCHHPYLKPNPNRTPHSINCAPALNQDEFEKYQRVQEIKKAKQESERQKLLEVDNSKSDLAQRGDLVNALGDNDTEDEDAKWSIKLVTIPISKKGKILRNKVSSEDIESLNGEADILSPSTFTKNDEMIPPEKSENVESYLKENELLDKEINEMMKEYLQEAKEIEKDIQKEGKKDENGEQEEKDELRQKEIELEQHLQEFKDLKKRLEYLMSKWMEIQKEENVREVVDNMKNSLEDLTRESDTTVKDPAGDSLNDYLNNLLDMMETYKKNAITQRKRLEDFQMYLETTLKKETSKQILAPPDGKEGASEEKIQDVEGVVSEGDNTHLSGIPDTDESSLSTQPEPSSPNPNTPLRLEDPLDAADPEVRESQSSTGEKTAEDVSEGDSSSSRHVKILDERTIDEDRKHRLEQTIKERLQKSGLDNIDDDEKDTLSSLSQEETEAFHNMIVNILSASAEELHERERHKSLELNYNFQLEEPDVQLEETAEEEVKQGEESETIVQKISQSYSVESAGGRELKIGGHSETPDVDDFEEPEDLTEELAVELGKLDSQTNGNVDMSDSETQSQD
ncbi:Protein OS-9, partial [Armadillidium nasatum]